MKYCTLLAALLCFVFVGTAVAADGLPSKATLSQMGLSSLESVSDSAGMDVRGKAFGTLTFSIPILNLTNNPATVDSLVQLGSSTFGNSIAIVSPGTGAVSRFGSVGTAQVFFDPATGLVDTVVDGGAQTTTVPVVATINGATTVLSANITFAGTIFAGGQ